MSIGPASKEQPQSGGMVIENQNAAYFFAWEAFVAGNVFVCLIMKIVFAPRSPLAEECRDELR